MCKNYNRQIYVISRVVDVMELNLPQNITNNIYLFNQYTTQTNAKFL